MKDEFWRPVATITGWQTTASICFYSVFAGTSLLGDVFSLSSSLIGLVLTMLMLGYTLSLFPVGALIDAHGERSVMVVGLFGLGLASFAIALAGSYLLLLAVVFCLGVLYSTAIPSTNRAIVHVVPEARTNLAMGIKQVGVTGGSAISAAVITSLGGLLFWNAGFIAVGILALAVLAVFALTYTGASGTGEPSLPQPWTLDVNAAYGLLLIAGFFFGAAMFTTIGYVVVFGTESIGASVAVSGLMLATVQIAGSASRIVSGQILDWLPQPEEVLAPRLLALYALVAAGGLLALPVVDTVSLGFVVFVVVGYALLGFMGIYYSYLSAIVRSEQMGEATAGAQTAVNLGAIVAPPAFGYLVDAISFDIAWVTLAGCCVAATVVFSVLAVHDETYQLTAS